MFDIFESLLGLSFYFPLESDLLSLIVKINPFEKYFPN